MTPRLLSAFSLALLVAACGDTRRAGPAADARARAKDAQAARPAAAAPREGILFAASASKDGGVTLDPIALVRPGGLVNPWEMAYDSAFAARYYAPGTAYEVRAGGMALGQATVRRMMEPGCQERIGEVALAARAPLADAWEALASDVFPAPAPPRPVAQTASGYHQSLLATLADSVHGAYHIPSAGRAAGENERMLAITVPGVRDPVLAGTFNVTAPRDGRPHTYSQMLIAEPHGDGYRPAYVFHARDDGEAGVRALLDAADLDGDGVPELVARARYAEGWGYVILRRGAGEWTEIYQGGGGGC